MKEKLNPHKVKTYEQLRDYSKDRPFIINADPYIMMVEKTIRVTLEDGKKMFLEEAQDEMRTKYPGRKYVYFNKRIYLIPKEDIKQDKGCFKIIDSNQNITHYP